MGPEAREPAGAPERESPGKPDDRPGVLVVDDEHLVRIMVRMGLERNGFAVWLASSGLEAIEVYRTHRERIAVILLDVRMPGLDGAQTLDALRELNPAVPACFMTGDGGNYAVEELIRRGASYVIDKPFVLNDLAQLLRQLADGR